jgi:hypothetical protein
MIDDEWGIEWIPLNVVIVRIQKVKTGARAGADQIVRLGYYATLEKALTAMVEVMTNHKVLGGSILTVVSLRDLICETKQTITRRLEAVANGKENTN